MPEILRDRDVIIFDKGTTFTVNVDDATALAGWRGGQGFQWEAPPSDELMAMLSNGQAAGFALWGSNEIPDEFTSMTRNQPTYKFVTLGAGGWIIATSTFEQYTYTSRQGPGPLVPIAYQPSDRLVFSNRGRWTKEDEWSLSGDPRAPNNYPIGFVAQVPSAALNWYMTIQISL